MAALIIIVGALKALCIYLLRATLSKCHVRQIGLSRIELGHSLSLALEFLVGADILKTAIAPTWNDIGQLAAIITIRTVLNFFLTWEVEQSEKEIALEKSLSEDSDQ